MRFTPFKFLTAMSIFCAPLVVLALSSAPAEARNACAKRQILVERLASKFGETRRAYGL